LTAGDQEVVVVDQFTKRVGTVDRRAWYVAGSKPTKEVTTAWEKVTILGAVTNKGRSFYCWTEENLTRHHGIRFLKALREEFGDNLVIFLDRAGYFFAHDVREFISDSTELERIGETAINCVRGESLELWYFPPKLPELNAVEGCWDQMQQWFAGRFVEDLSQLKQELATVISEITVPNIWNYLCNSE